MDGFSPGVYSKVGRAPGPTPMPTAAGPGSFADRTFGVEFSGAADASTRGVTASGTFGVSGLVTLAMFVAGLFLVDRYVVDVPGIGK